jgi:hypothetical protein
VPSPLPFSCCAIFHLVLRSVVVIGVGTATLTFVLGTTRAQPQPESRCMFECMQARCPYSMQRSGGPFDPNRDYCKRMHRICVERCDEGEEPACDLAEMAQSLLDFDRAFADTLTTIPFVDFSLTKSLRERLYRESGETIKQDAAALGSGSGHVASLASIFIPGLGGFTVLRDFSEGAVLTADAAKAVKASSNIIWFAGEGTVWVTMRGKIIENAVAILEYLPKNYRWVGVLKGGTFRTIDFIHEYQKEAVSLKTIFRVDSQGWVRATKEMQEHIDLLADINNVWVTWKGRAPSPEECKELARTWKRILDIRVPKGHESELQSLISYGQARGVTVKISGF